MPTTEKRGEPDIKIGGLNIWVHGRQFPDSQTYWDSNVLNVTAEYIGRDSRVLAHGSFIHLGYLAGFLAALKAVHSELKGEALLDCVEPNLRVVIAAKSLGHLEVKTTITADQMTESHVYKEQMDQTFLPPILEDLRKVLALYPVRESGKVPL